MKKIILLVASIAIYAQANAQSIMLKSTVKLTPSGLETCIQDISMPISYYPLPLSTIVYQVPKALESEPDSYRYIKSSTIIIDSSDEGSTKCFTIPSNELDFEVDSVYEIRVTHINPSNSIPFTRYTEIIFHGFPTGMNRLVPKKILTYPNPARYEITITGLPQGDQIEVYNTDGKILTQVLTSQEGESKVNISSLSSGIYFVKTKSGFSKKILKE